MNSGEPNEPDFTPTNNARTPWAFGAYGVAIYAVPLAIAYAVMIIFGG